MDPAGGEFASPQPGWYVDMRTHRHTKPGKTMKGTGSYPDNWVEIANEAKDAAGWRCIRCGHPMARWIKGGQDPQRYAFALQHKFGKSRDSYRLRSVEGGTFMVATWLPCDRHCLHLPDGKQRVLTVHHFDGNKANSAWWNLGALCQADHLSVQARLIMDQTYLGEHTPWFRPYVAGFYAHHILGEDLTREEVEARMDELLALGQPHLEG